MSIHNNTKYEYIRFNDGREVFAMVSEFNDKLELHLPMNIVTKPSNSGGIVIHLGPMNPFTMEDTMIVNTRDVQLRSSITDTYIGFYDKACTSWLEIRDNGGIEIKSVEDEQQLQGNSIRQLIQDKIRQSQEVPDDFWDEYDKEELIDDYELPSKKDIIH